MLASRLFITLVAMLALKQSVSAFVVTNCAAEKQTDAKLLNFHVDSCPDQSAERCTFYRGENASLQLQLEPSKYINSAS